jgi:hypothetical protein
MEISFCLEEEPEAKRRMKRGGNVLLHPSSPLLPLAFKKEKPRGYIRNHKKADSVFFCNRFSFSSFSGSSEYSK